jgi:hypothetical protein
MIGVDLTFSYGFSSDELRERVTGLYGVAPTIDFIEIAEVVDNTAS